MKRVLIPIIASIMLVACEGEFEEGGDVQATPEIVTVSQTPDENIVINTTLTSEEVEYLDLFKGVDAVFSESTESIIDRISEATSDESLYTDNQWNQNLKDSFMRISISHNLLTELSDNELVPEKFEEIHLLLVRAFADVNLAGDLMFTGIEDDINMATISGSSTLMIEALDVMVKVDKVLSEKLQ